MDNKYSIKGYAQKGPFIIGTPITLSELNHSLVQTGKNFIAKIGNDEGVFELPEIELQSNYISLSANEFYFDEVTRSAPHNYI